MTAKPIDLSSLLISSPPSLTEIPSTGRPYPTASACADSFSKAPTFRTPLRDDELPEISVLDSDCLMAKKFGVFLALETMLALGDSLDLGVNPEACAVAEPGLWRQWREMRNSTSHTYDEAKAAEVAAGVEQFAAGATALLAELEKSLGR